MVVSNNRIQSSRIQVKSRKIPLGQIKLQTNFCGFFPFYVTMRRGASPSSVTSYPCISLNPFSAPHFFHFGDVSLASLMLVTSPLHVSLSSVRTLCSLSYNKGKYRANAASWFSSCSEPSQPLLKPLLWGVSLWLWAQGVLTPAQCRKYSCVQKRGDCGNKTYIDGYRGLFFIPPPPKKRRHF